MKLEEKIGKSELFSLAGKVPVFVINGRVYYCSEGEGVFKTNGESQEVKEGPLLSALERISFKEMQPEFGKFKESFAKKELKSLLKYGEQKESDYTSGDNRLAKFAVNEVFPYLRKDYGLDDILEPEKAAKNLQTNGQFNEQTEKYIQERKSQLIVNEITLGSKNSLDNILFNLRTSISNRRDSCLAECSGGVDFAIFKKHIYSLALAGRNEDLRIDGRKYILVDFCTLPQFLKNYSARVKKILSESALDSLKEFDISSPSTSNTGKIYSKKEHQEGDFGFINNRGSVTVYVKVPDYVLKSPESDTLYVFPGHKLGIDIGIDYNGGMTLREYPHSLTQVAGPFYFDDGRLCMGNYGYSYLDKMAKGRAFAKLLLDARNVVLKGYRRGSNPASSLGNFYARKISKAEVQKRNLPITNINYQRAHDK